MVNASMSASSSPSKPLSPHTPHTPAIPSRLSENSIIDYAAQGQVARVRTGTGQIDAMEEEEAEEEDEEVKEVKVVRRQVPSMTSRALMDLLKERSTFLSLRSSR